VFDVTVPWSFPVANGLASKTATWAITDATQRLLSFFMHGGPHSAWLNFSIV
jgi:hypothetical protein